MPIPTYTPGYPPDGSSLGQTKSTIRNNLDGTFETLAIDHIDNNGQPGSNPAGYHKVIHEVTQTNVTTVAGVNQVFSGVPGTLIVNGTTTNAIPPDGNTQFFSLNSGGGLHQLTGSILSSSTNGYAWMGGILVQWGKLANSSISGSVAFTTSNVNFPNGCFNVSLTATKFGALVSLINLVNGSVSATGFSFTFSSIPSDFYWIAIGN